MLSVLLPTVDGGTRFGGFIGTARFLLNVPFVHDGIVGCGVTADGSC